MNDSLSNKEYYTYIKNAIFHQFLIQKLMLEKIAHKKVVHNIFFYYSPLKMEKELV